MPTWLRRTLIIVGIIIALLIAGFFLSRNLHPNTKQIQEKTLPSILDRLTPRSGDIDNIPADPTGGILNPDEIVITDAHLKDGQKKIAQIESTLGTYRKKVNEAQDKLASYEAQSKGVEGSAVTKSIYGDDFDSKIAEVKKSIEYYNKIIYVYESLVQKFKASMVYYYCNGFTPKLPGETVDISKLANNIIIVTHTNGTTTQVSCNWDGTPTEFTIDSPYHPKNFFEDLPPDFLVDNPFENVSFNYETTDQWGKFTSQLTDVVWTSTPPVWYYYLNVFLTIYIDVSIDISIDISGLWNLIFDAYPIDDVTRYSNVHIWVDRYKTFNNNGVLTVWGLLQTGHPMNQVCPVLRMGVLTKASWHYRLQSNQRSQNFTDENTCKSVKQADPLANQSIACKYEPGTNPDPNNPPEKLKDFFKNILKDIKESFTLKYYMDGLDPGSITEYPINIINTTKWVYTVLPAKTPSAAYATESECTTQRDQDLKGDKSTPCTYSYQVSSCSATVPGQSKMWYVTIPGYDQSQPYLYDIIDAYYRAFQFNWNTFTVSEMAYRYWGPQFVSQTDTQNVYANLQQSLTVPNQETADRTGFPIRYTYDTNNANFDTLSDCESALKANTNAKDTRCTPNSYTSAYQPDDQTAQLLFRVQTYTDRRVQQVPGQNQGIFSLPLKLNYTTNNGNGTVTIHSISPSLISKRLNENNTTDATGQVTVSNQYDTVYLYYELPGKILPTDTFALIDVQREEVLVGESEFQNITTYSASNQLNRFANWWIYTYKPTPTTESQSKLYPTRVACEVAARKQFPTQTPPCTLTVADNIAVLLDVGNSKLEQSKGELKFIVRGDIGVVVPIMKRLGYADVAANPTQLQMDGKKQSFAINFAIDSTKPVGEFEIVNTKNGTVLSSGTYDAARKLYGTNFVTNSDIYTSELGKTINEFTNQVFQSAPNTQPTTEADQKTSGILPNPLGDIKTFPGIVSKYARIIPAFIAGWITLNIVVLALRMITTDGRQEKIDSLTTGLRWGAFGTFIMLIIYALMASFESIVSWFKG